MVKVAFVTVLVNLAAQTTEGLLREALVVHELALLLDQVFFFLWGVALAQGILKVFVLHLNCQVQVVQSLEGLGVLHVSPNLAVHFLVFLRVTGLICVMTGLLEMVLS